MNTRRRRRFFLAMFACVSTYGLTHGFLTPLLSLILEGRGAERSLIGLMAGVPAIGMLLASPLIPSLVVRFGLKPFLLLCLVADIALCLMFPLLDHVGAWLALRFLMGMTVSGLFIAAETWINEVAEDETRGRLMAAYSALMTASFAAGPILIPLTGTHGFLPFATGAAIIGIAALPLLWIGPVEPASDAKASFSIWSFARVAPVISAAVLLFGFAYFAQTALLPVYGVRSGLSEAGAAAMLTALGAGGVLLQLPIGWFADRVNRVNLLVLCAAATGVGALLLPFAIDRGLVLWILLFVWGGFFSGIYTLSLTLIGQHFRGAELVTANAAVGVVWGVGSLIGPLLAGAAMDVWDPHGLPATLVLASAAFVLMGFVRLPRRAAA